MEVFNKITCNQMIHEPILRISCIKSAFTFNVKATQLLALKTGDRIAFARDEITGKLYLILDPKNGFRLKVRNEGFAIFYNKNARKKIIDNFKKDTFEVSSFNEGKWELIPIK